jgi:hypothetical protein
LLNPGHARGHSKEAFFTAHGFARDAHAVLAEALVAHVRTHDATPVEGQGLRHAL